MVDGKNQKKQPVSAALSDEAADGPTQHDVVRGPLGFGRETVESLVIAFTLALLFRAFEAEAFVIPTGSMAPTLMGRHKDLDCNYESKTDLKNLVAFPMATMKLQTVKGGSSINNLRI